MFYIKEDDMDEMLRRAADNYDPDAEKAYDWNSVYAAVHEKEPVINVPAAIPEKRKRRFAFWWMLLIPLSWLADNEWNKFKSKDAVSNSAEHSISSQKPYAADTVFLNDKSTITNVFPKQSLPVNNYIVKPFLQARHPIVFSQDKRSSANKIISSFLEDTSLQQNKTQQFQQKQNEFPDKINATDKATINDSAKNIFVQTPLAKPDINNQENNAVPKAPAAASLNKKENNNDAYLYAGIIAGPDVSFVKFQKMEAAGVNVGLLVGYHFNKLSIETGILYSKKNYYTKGEYFDKSKIAYFNNAEVLSVNGYCHMFEIPLNFKYNFVEKKNHAWFAAAGLSSYLMNKEYYNYKYIENNTTHQNGFSYYHSDKNLFAIMNLSAGYELKTGNKSALRIEPYYKIPLSGVGTGKLYLSSAGLNIGLIKHIP